MRSPKGHLEAPTHDAKINFRCALLDVLNCVSTFMVSIFNNASELLNVHNVIDYLPYLPLLNKIIVHSCLK